VTSKDRIQKFLYQLFTSKSKQAVQLCLLKKVDALLTQTRIAVKCNITLAMIAVHHRLTPFFCLN